MYENIQIHMYENINMKNVKDYVKEVNIYIYIYIYKSSGIMCNCLYLKQNKESCNLIEIYSTKIPVTHIETNHLICTCTASEVTIPI